jgi:hypothetical protein
VDVGVSNADLYLNWLHYILNIIILVIFRPVEITHCEFYHVN